MAQEGVGVMFANKPVLRVKGNTAGSRWALSPGKKKSQGIGASLCDFRAGEQKGDIP